MKIKPLLVLTLLLLVKPIFAQDNFFENIPSLALQNIEFQIKSETLPDTLDHIQLIFDKDSETFSLDLYRNNFV